MRRPALYLSVEDALGTGVTADAPDPVQDPLDREVLAAHFAGYDLEPVLSVALSPVTLVDVRAPGNREGVAR
jgi:hypothetical protein